MATYVDPITGRNVESASAEPINDVLAMTINTVYPAGRRFAVVATAAGAVSVTYAGGSTSSYPVAVGLNIFLAAITKWTGFTGGAAGVCENQY